MLLTVMYVLNDLLILMRKKKSRRRSKSSKRRNTGIAPANDPSKYISKAEIEDVLECPVCYKSIMDPPIYECDSEIMHALCQNCHDTLFQEGSPCPECRGKLTKRRSRLAEKLVEKLPKIFCKFEGCTFARADAEAVKHHEDNMCSGRMISCFMCLDEEQGLDQEPYLYPLGAYIDHVTRAHSVVTYTVHGFSGEGQNFPFSTAQNELVETVFRLEEGGRNYHFLFYHINNPNSGCFLFWMTFVGPRDEADKFEFRLRIHSYEALRKGRTEYLLDSYRRCVPCNISYHEMMMMQEFLAVDSEIIERAVRGNRDKILKICLTITQS